MARHRSAHVDPPELRAASRVLPAPPRVAIEDVAPEIDAGRFAVKRVLGEKIVVSARVFADGRDSVAAALQYRRRHESLWREVPMEPLLDDVWTAAFEPEALGSYEYTVRAWIDRFGTWRKETAAKLAAGVDCSLEFLEGAGLLDESLSRAAPQDARALRRASAALREGSAREKAAAARDAEIGRIMTRCGERRGLAVFDRVLRAAVERERARFGAWYEMFPRSAGGDARRGAGFREAEARLAGIAGMGFDVLYLPPIHPIGRTLRKGPGNSVRAGPDDPGSPWAIGSAEGGHKDVDPGLGTLADFDHFLAAAKTVGLEIALDAAFQCSPDHPYVREHPGWFRRRPDGSVQYAENPPKKYEDIYPLDFECADWRALWDELIGVVLFWARRGVRAFRVDNPHTKPFRFWKELIHAVRAEFPETVFLAEAFTRPSVLRELSKCGFSQSYTYFIWRNTKAELTEYLTELTKSAEREYLRPNFFVNTPDILPLSLQAGGRPAHEARLVLAATLGASYGVYGPPFELCESLATAGTEEYLRSEKYEIRRWEWDRPGNIKPLIARVNRIRHENPALRGNERLEFLTTDNDQLIAYAKTTEDLSNVVVVVVNLDPRNVQSGWVQIPWRRWGMADDETHLVDDLLQDARYPWRGSSNFVRLDPNVCPAHILSLHRPSRDAGFPVVAVTGGWDSFLEGLARKSLETAIIPEFLARQRWFADKSRPIRAVRLIDLGRLPSAGEARLCLVAVTHEDGGEEAYSLPLCVVAGPAGDRLQISKPESILALLEVGGRTAALCDAWADDAFCLALLDAFRSEAEIPSGDGRIKAFKTAAFSTLEDALASPPVARGGMEQSNSSVRYGSRLILKLFRRLQPGRNPELEIGLALARRPRFDRVPRLAGGLELERRAREPFTLAVVQELIANEGDAWSRAASELRRYFESVMFRGRPPVARVLEPWLRSARALGRRTAELHLALAEDLGDPEFTPEPFTEADLALTARGVRESSAHALETLERGLDAVAPELRPLAARLLSSRAALAAKLQLESIGEIPGGKIRCHGDYHLGQLLCAGEDFYILDFEGEPARPLAQRRSKQSPLRDVAGMLRSFDYAANAGRFAFAPGDQAEQARLEPWARGWRDWTGEAFLDEYRRTAAGAPFLPADPEQFAELLDLFTLEKAFYELAYELDDRPEWAGIPLRGLLRLLETRVRLS